MKGRMVARASRLSMAVVWACALAACGGGGSTRSDPPPVSPPPAAPPPTPPVVYPPSPGRSLHLTWTGADLAHAAGFTGAGIRIGIVDSGVNRHHPAMRDGRVIANLTYINPATNNLSVDDVVGHGTAVAQTAAGKPFGSWPGGIAPDAEIVSARIINDERPRDDGSGRGNEVSGALGLAPIHRDLIARGVRIMNNSWGGLYWTNPAATDPIAAEYRPFVLEHGGLVVFSAGNSGFDDPSDTAALPSQPGTGGSLPAAALERGWLTVVALSQSSPEHLADYSNACGLAMRYCLAAPGTVVVTGTSDPPNAPEYWQWSGTSFAAPIVSGAAALVWEAFPYFDNDLVRQTLLGTATDLGAPGVDPVFGYGSVDIAAAVRGPGRFDWGDVVADFDDLHSVWGNSISGSGGLVKRGSGVLELAGPEAAYGGDTRIEQGELRLATNLTGSDVHVARDATLRFNGGSVYGDVDNDGVLVLYRDINGPGGIGGDYVHGRDASLHVFLGTGSLDVGGNVVIEGGTLHVAGTTEGYTRRARETIIASASAGVQGRFDALTFDTDLLFLEAELQYNALFVEMVINRLDVLAAARRFAAIGPSALSAARRVEAAFDAIDANEADGHAAIDRSMLRVAGALQRLGSEAEAVAAFDSLSGESHALATSLTFDAADMGRRALSLRLGALQPGAGHAAAWKQALGAGGTGMAGGGFQPDGWLMGRDLSPGNGLVSGFAFGETRAEDWVGGNRDRSRDRQTQAALYVGRVTADGYAFAHASSGRFDRHVERRLFDGGEARAGVFAGYSGTVTGLGIEAGRPLRFGDWRITPYLGADHVRVSHDGFEEWGSGYALRTGAATLQRTQATAGLRAAFDWRGTRLHAWSEWQQTLSASGFDRDASFVGLDAWSPLPAAAAARSGGLFGARLDAPAGRDAWLSFGVDRRFGPRGDEYMGTLRYLRAF